MLRKMMLAVIPMVALTGLAKADDLGLADLSDSAEVDALTAAIAGDEIVADAEVLAVSGSEATEDVDAEGVCFYGGYGWGGYNYGWGCGWNCYRVYRPVVYHFNYCAPVYGGFYGGYGCW